ncbi:carboxymuconolactone decarboxylase family protein [Paenibacillus sp. SN-8-1]|uniref:carboxymuconolactone decarboxylase family protein n=1 Tax=Paenibacillus sp. SN-8-1 TaxID=3435409 RepID=UPI003D9AB0B6
MTNAYKKGEQLLMDTYQDGIKGVLDNLKEISPHIGRYIVEFFGQVFVNPLLSYTQREMITIAALTSLGDCPGQLKWHIQFGMKVGLTPEEIVELITHTVPFSGFPRALNAITTAKQVFEELEIRLTVQDELLNAENIHAAGLRKLKEVDGEHGELVIESLAGIAPVLADQIVDFTFGEIYSRTLLNTKQRQLVTLAALTAQGGCEPQLRVHIHAALRSGLTEQEVIEALLQCYPYTGFPKVLNAVSTARQIFELQT